MSEAAKLQLFALTRAVLYFLGASGFDLGHHFDSETQVQIAGAIVFCAAFCWSVVEKRQLEAKAKAREFVAINAGILISDRVAGPTPLVPASEVPALIAIVAPKLPIIEAASTVHTEAAEALSKPAPGKP